MDELIMKPLEKEFDYFLENRNFLINQYEGKYIVIKDCKLIGVYNNALNAIKETSKQYELGTFLVQLCSRDENSFIQKFNSRVYFE